METIYRSVQSVDSLVGMVYSCCCGFNADSSLLPQRGVLISEGDEEVYQLHNTLYAPSCISFHHHTVCPLSLSLCFGHYVFRRPLISPAYNWLIRSVYPGTLPMQVSLMLAHSTQRLQVPV